MKKQTILTLAVLTLISFHFSSCSMRMFEGRTYVNGQHASKQGAKVQTRVNKQTKHFWF